MSSVVLCWLERPTASPLSRSHRKAWTCLLSFSNMSISSVSCATLALSAEMFVSSVEILALSAVICSYEIMWSYFILL